MLRLVLFRHAKSSWSNADLSDFERPLNTRGRENTPRMADELKPFLKGKFQVISSPACRAATTARLAVHQWKLTEAAIQYESALYHASKETIWKLIRQQNPSHQTIILFGHNEGLTELASSCSKSVIEHLPTAGVAVFDFNKEAWSAIQVKDAQLVNFNYPKKG